MVPAVSGRHHLSIRRKETMEILALVLEVVGGLTIAFGIWLFGIVIIVWFLPNRSTAAREQPAAQEVIPEPVSVRIPPVRNVQHIVDERVDWVVSELARCARCEDGKRSVRIADFYHGEHWDLGFVEPSVRSDWIFIGPIAQIVQDLRKHGMTIDVKTEEGSWKLRLYASAPCNTGC